MDELQEIMLEECSLDGVQGSELVPLLDFVASRSGARFDSKIKNLLWKRLVGASEVDFRDGSGGGSNWCMPGAAKKNSKSAQEMVDRRPIIPKEELASLDWAAVCSRSGLRVVASQAMRMMALGVKSTQNLQMSYISLCILEEVGRAREKGLYQKDIVKLVQEVQVDEKGEYFDDKIKKLDAKAVFYYLKPLKGLLTTSGITITNGNTKHDKANVSKYTKTNILRLARYQEDSKLLTLGARYVSDVGPQLQQVLDLLSEHRDCIMSEIELKRQVVTGIKSDEAVKFRKDHHLHWVRIRNALHASGKAEKVLVKNGKGLKSCIRLISKPEAAASTAPIWQIPLKYQFMSAMAARGSDGCARLEIPVANWLDTKTSAIICEDLVQNHGVEEKAERNLKQMSYKYVAPTFAPKTAAPAGQEGHPGAMFSHETPGGIIDKEAASKFRITVEWVARHEMWEGPVTQQWVSRANSILDSLARSKVISWNTLKHTLKSHDVDNKLQGSMDPKTIERQVNMLCKMGFCTIKTQQVVKRTTIGSRGDESACKSQRFLVCKTVDFSDERQARKLFAKASEKVITHLQHVPVIPLPEDHAFAPVRKYEEKVNTMDAVYQFIINGYTTAKVVRASALHKHLVCWYLAQDAPGGFMMDELLMEMPLLLFLQTIGAPFHFEGIAQLSSSGILMKNLEEAQRSQFVSKNHVDTALLGLIDILQDLDLISPELVASDGANLALSDEETKSKTFRRFMRVTRSAQVPQIGNEDGEVVEYRFDGVEGLKSYQQYWKDACTLFATTWNKTSAVEGDVMRPRSWSLLCKRSSWVWRSDTTVTTSQRSQVMEIALDLQGIDPHTAQGVQQVLKVMSANAALSMTRETVARILQRVPSFEPAFQEITLGSVAGRGSNMRSELVQNKSGGDSKSGDARTRKRSAPPLMQGLSKQRRTGKRSSAPKNSIPIGSPEHSDGEGKGGGDNGVEDGMEEDDDNFEEDEMARRRRRSRLAPMRDKRVMWTYETDIKLVATYGYEHRQLVSRRAQAMEAYLAVSSGGTEDTVPKPKLQKFDWDFVAKHMCMKKTRLQRRILALRGDVQHLKLLERLVMASGARFELLAGERGGKGDDGSGETVWVEAKDETLEQLRDLHTVHIGLLEGGQSSHAAALRAVEGQPFVPLPASLDDMKKSFKVQHLWPENQDPNVRAHPWPGCTDLQACLIEQLVVLLSTDTLGKEEVEDILDRYITNDTEEALRRLGACSMLKKRSSKLSKSAQDSINPSRNFEALIDSMIHYSSRQLPKILGKGSLGEAREWELGGTAGDGETAVIAAMMMGRAIEATSQPGEDAFEEKFEGREGNRYGTGLSAHIQMLGKHLEGGDDGGEDQNDRNEDLGGIPDFPTRFEVVDELWRGMIRNTSASAAFSSMNVGADGVGAGAKEASQAAGNRSEGLDEEQEDVVERLLEDGGFAGKQVGVWGRGKEGEEGRLGKTLAVIKAGGDNGANLTDIFREIDRFEGEEEDLEAVIVCLQNRRQIVRVRAFDHHRYVAIEHALAWSAGTAEGDASVKKAQEGGSSAAGFEDTEMHNASQKDKARAASEGQVAGPWLGLKGQSNQAFMKGLEASVLDTVCKHPGISLDRLVGRYAMLGKRTACDVVSAMMDDGLLKMRSQQVPRCSLSSPAIPRYVPRLPRGLLGGLLTCQVDDPSVERYVIPGGSSTLLMAAGGRASVPFAGHTNWHVNKGGSCIL